MRAAALFTLVAAVAGWARDAGAQELNLAAASSERPHVVLVRTGVDHALMLDVGYRHVTTWGGRQILLGGDLGAPSAGLDAGDYRARLSASVTLLGGAGAGWKLSATLSPTLRATTNAAGKERALGADARLTAGYYAGWWIAGELGADWAATTHIQHDAAYRDVYPGARDGWYGSPGGTLYAGVTTGVSIRSVDLLLRVGVPRAIDLGPQTIPAFALIGVNVRLPR